MLLDSATSSGWDSITTTGSADWRCTWPGPLWLRLLLNGFVVFVGFLILSGAVNTSIVGSNGVLEPRGRRRRAARLVFEAAQASMEHTSRVLWLITGMQLFTIIVSRGDVIMLGEAYAFGVVWSFVFKTLSMVVLRFKDRHAARIHGAVQHSLGPDVQCRWVKLRVFDHAAVGPGQFCDQAGGDGERL